MSFMAESFSEALQPKTALFQTEVIIHDKEQSYDVEKQNGIQTELATQSLRSLGSSQSIRLPLAVNFISLRESFLSEAPFVTT